MTEICLRVARCYATSGKVTAPDGDRAPALDLRVDVAFRGEEVGKGEHVTPATYRNRIAASLQQTTGHLFGAAPVRKSELTTSGPMHELRTQQAV